MRTIIFLFVFFIASLAISPSLKAQDSSDENSGLDYHSILSQYSRTKEVQRIEDPFELIKFHAGVGLTNTFFSADTPDAQKVFISQRGVQASLGIDLFSKAWMAEGTFANYGDDQFKNIHISLKEFDLRLIYRNQMSSQWGIKIGGGLAARYLKMSSNAPTGGFDREYSTPDSEIVAGLEAYVTQGLSVGVEMAGRSTLIDDTPESTSMDFGVRIDGHF